MTNQQALLVEDNPVALMAASMLLKKLGITVDTAQSGQEALERVKHKHYPIIFLDLRLPDMSGIELAKRLKHSVNKEHPVTLIALTAHSKERYEEECEAAGIHFFLSKPITKEQISDLLIKLEQKKLI